MKFARDNWWFRGRSFGLSVSFREVDEKFTSGFTDWSEKISSNISIWPYSLVWTIYFSRWKRSNPNWFWGDDASSDHSLKGRHRWFLGNHRNHHEPIVSLWFGEVFCDEVWGSLVSIKDIGSMEAYTNQNTRRVAILGWFDNKWRFRLWISKTKAPSEGCSKIIQTCGELLGHYSSR